MTCREEEKRLAAASQPDVHTLMTPTSRNRQGATGGGLVSARRRVANQRDSKDGLPSIVGSNRGHHDKDASGSESGASHTHHLPGQHAILLTNLNLVHVVTCCRQTCAHAGISSDTPSVL